MFTLPRSLSILTQKAQESFLRKNPPLDRSTDPRMWFNGSSQRCFGLALSHPRYVVHLGVVRPTKAVEEFPSIDRGRGLNAHLLLVVLHLQWKVLLVHDTILSSLQIEKSGIWIDCCRCPGPVSFSSRLIHILSESLT